MKYCLGFWFSEGHEQVVMIMKKRPSFLAGKFNGVGGKVEEGERERHAMVREFHEETGVNTHLADWFFLGRQVFAESEIYVFYGFGDVSQVRTMTDEHVHIVPVDHLNNLRVDDFAREKIFESLTQIDERKISMPKH